MSKIDARVVQGIVARKGFHICVGIPAALMVVGLMLRSQFEFLSSPISSEENLVTLGYSLLAICPLILVVAFILKRRLVGSQALKARINSRPGDFADILSEAMAPIFLIVTAPALVGLIFYFLGGDLDTYVLISVFCPAGLMLCRPREDDIERLDRELFGSEE